MKGVESDDRQRMDVLDVTSAVVTRDRPYFAAYYLQKGFAMLVLSRKLYETIVIGNNVRVTIVGIQGGKIRLGIEAPSSVEVHREEILKRISVEESPE